MAYNFLTLAKDVLEKENIPLSVEEIWEKAKVLGLLEKLSSSGKTPIRTLSARIYVDIKNNVDTIFEQVSKRPAKFFLKDHTAGLQEFEERQEQTGKKLKYLERDLHVLLSSFVNSDEHFKCSTKTIYHEVSKREKSGKNKWLHPDIVGVHFPFESYTENTLKLFDILKVNPYKLYSFEMKISINLATLREYYFQAVSNSSWAHEGYLVALHIVDDPELIDEMRRLNNAFGIGVIRLDAEHFMQSEILFSAKEKESLDWDTINRLVDSNSDFKKFLDDLMEDIKIGKVKSKYDDVCLEEEQMYQYALNAGILS
ncbi:COG2958 family protein [Lacrimispora sp.]|uniref:COG2958 family protein n=1 Tax=Lacrimispora sp. TaxID=2719234 RepID=UPI0028A21CF8|nr:HTH domain-containing protein [Lacrimispora sp.]